MGDTYQIFFALHDLIHISRYFGWIFHQAKLAHSSICRVAVVYHISNAAFFLSRLTLRWHMTTHTYIFLLSSLTQILTAVSKHWIFHFLVGGQLVALYVWSNISFLVIFDREKKKMGGVGGKKKSCSLFVCFFLNFCSDLW